jgi:hypothetical protein
VRRAHLSPVPDWLAATVRSMMCRHWAPGARRPGRPVVRPQDMTLDGRLWGEFRRDHVLCPSMIGSRCCDFSIGSITAKYSQVTEGCEVIVVLALYSDTSALPP